MKFELTERPPLAALLLICARLPEDEREQYEAFTGEPFNSDDMALGLGVKTGPSWLLTADGEPISAAGFDYIRPGVWQDWQVNTPEAYGTHWRTTIKHVKRVMDGMLDQTDARRLQCVSLSSRIHAHRMYSVLGLAPEGTLHGYGAQGEDAIMFARLKEGMNGRRIEQQCDSGSPAS